MLETGRLFVNDTLLFFQETIRKRQVGTLSRHLTFFVILVQISDDFTAEFKKKGLCLQMSPYLHSTRSLRSESL